VTAGSGGPMTDIATARVSTGNQLNLGRFRVPSRDGERLPSPSSHIGRETRRGTAPQGPDGPASAVAIALLSRQSVRAVEIRFRNGGGDRVRPVVRSLSVQPS
jgi:hypothetical protein